MTEQTPLPVDERPEGITIYSKPKCVQCTATERHLNDAHVEYTKIDASEDEAALARMKELGYLQAPVVVLPNGHHWSGYRPDHLNDVIVETEALQPA
ncbi:glutaredoxin domain-containing protein [Leucobacter sp. cx-169]|uniref:glutaredoxin domain-containing protein n=1 Tax=Leucobacter sp. cx-169 TaxID=2770549 RepID=UPI00165E8660|nr:glutaredoxin domain-containing protein [Leucobacter sp. cx-169]MBC9927366.1 NrdH-redoxin [Leucobacter sp. cx-169]